MPRKPRVSVLAAIRQAISDTALRVGNAAAEFRAPAPRTAAEPAGLYEPDEMPAVEDIAVAARNYEIAAEQARRADRGKRSARKLLDRLPAGQYGGWLVERIPSGRSTVDLNEVRRIFKANGLGDVPMKTAAPSLKVKRLNVPAPVETGAQAVAL
jgi:hypothetical protein